MTAPAIIAPDAHPAVFGEQFREGIRKAIMHGTGLADVRWDNEPEGWRGDVRLELRPKTLRGLGGLDDVRRENHGDGTYRETQMGDRVLMLRLYCEARATGGDRAEAYLHRFESGWQVSGVREYLEALAGVAIADVHAVQPMPDRLSAGRDVSVAILDLELNAVAHFESAITRNTFTSFQYQTEVSPAGQPAGDPSNIVLPPKEIP